MYGFKYPNIDTHAQEGPTERYYQAYLESSQISAMERFCGNRKRLLAVNYFRRNAPSHMFDWVLNILLIMENSCSWNSKMS